MKTVINKIGIPRLIISILFIIVLVAAKFQGLPMSMLLTDIIKRFGMYGILVLAMVPSIQSGVGPNFALPIGILCGLMGAVLSVEFGFVGVVALIAAILFAIPIALLIGYLYGKLLNVVKGSEMTIATYTGFSMVQLMCIAWIALPFSNKKMVWPIGKGLRNTFTLDTTFGHILNNFWDFHIGGVHIPTGLILFFLLMCFLVFLFTKSKTGIVILAAGMNPNFAEASGVNINRGRIIANMLSTVLGAIGIIIYSSSYGFVQLYGAPLMMAFPAVAAILIGGATAKRAKISHVIIGVLLFQGLLASSMPVANEMFPEGNVSEMIRMVVQNGIILYALTKVKGGKYVG
ncbi:ABC transporter permease subunit [Vallitalea guaymasensis]|uniref:ABC transporter permease n=1 Tax=Vallitalea guaymasensis TaxID=1185412 RepID=A0A8J8MDC8_9FIRM|nr:ABC transporter permease [Vallitalea guaymasensis]QUH30871.1 ABC transporter permease [Vallitalea guaymasensis]